MKESMKLLSVERVNIEGFHSFPADASETGRKFFLSEMEVSKVLKSHINVIQLIGCYTLNGEL